MTSIIPATLTDIDAIMQLVKSCIAALEAQGIDQWCEHYPTAAVFTEDINEDSLYVCKENEVIVGVVAVNEKQPENYKQLTWPTSGERVLVVHRLAVHPERQKEGLGRRLMDFIEASAVERGYTSIRLEAYSSNLPVLRFYERRGYIRVGEISFPFRSLPFVCYEKVLG